MKITYTPDDGKHWEAESECHGWERFQKLLEADRHVHEPGEDPEVGTEFDSVLEWLAPSWGDREHIFLEHNLWAERRHLYRVVDLLKQAEAA